MLLVWVSLGKVERGGRWRDWPLNDELVLECVAPIVDKPNNIETEILIFAFTELKTT